MKNRLKQLFTYINKVYHIGEKINSLKDKRIQPQIKNSTITIIVMLSFMLQYRSFNRITYSLDRKKFEKIFPSKTRMPKIDAIRNQLSNFDLEGLKEIHKDIIDTTIKNKIFREGTIDGYKVAGIDGVELYESTKKCCDKCLTREINEVTHYFHRSVMIATIGKDPRIVIGQEMLEAKKDGTNKDEGETTGAKRLIKRIYEEHHHFADVVVGDAAYGNAKWINELIALGIDAVARVKDERRDIVKDALGIFKDQRADKEWRIKGDTRDKYTIAKAWDVDEIEMQGLEMKIRFVKFTLEIHEKDKVRRKEIWIITTNKVITVETLLKIIQKRWDIENCIFHQIKTEWHMKHCYLHSESGVETVLMLMIIGFNLMQLYFFRCIRGFREKKMLQIDIVEDVKDGLILWEKGMKNPLLNTG